MNKIYLLLIFLCCSCTRLIGVDCNKLDYTYYQNYGFTKNEIDNYCMESTKHGIDNFSLQIHPITRKKFNNK